MIRISQLKMPCGHSGRDLENRIRKVLRIGNGTPLHMEIRRHSVDARKKPVLFDIYTVDVDLRQSPAADKKLAERLRNRDVTAVAPAGYSFPAAGTGRMTRRPVVIGAGPAGLFCALMLAENGYYPLLLERGKCVEERDRSIREYWESGVLDPSSNVQFGEGGAGTFSDGKLNTQINDKTGRSEQVLKIFVEAGAPRDILYEARPHIGTDKLKEVIPAIRRRILAAGGDVRFGAQVTDLDLEGGRVRAVILADGTRLETDTVVLAPGHSARDTIRSLFDRGIPMEPKAFAIGFRISHPQSLIDRSQYGVWEKEDLDRLGLSAASYKLTARAASGRGVYSFCMCPGGYIVDASSETGRIAVNGMSEHARNSARANSAIVCTVGPEEFGGDHPLEGIRFQRELEEKAYRLGKGAVPVQRYQLLKEKFLERESADPGSAGQSAGQEDLPDPYLQEHDLCIRGRWNPADLSSLLPPDLTRDFIEGMEDFGRKIEGFAGPEAVAAGIEARTSSPVRIPRGEDLQSQIRGLYPCGEGAGYAGGIMSAAMDGLRVAEAIRKTFEEPSVAQVKRWKRRQALAVRNAVSEEEREARSRQIFEEVTKLSDYRSAECVLCYYSIGSEVLTRQFIDRALIDGKKVYLPRILSREEMRFYRYVPGERLQVSDRGIPEPQASESGDYDTAENGAGRCLVIVPGLSFDSRGGRLGYGGGYYDRFLREHPEVSVCAVSFREQMTENVPMGPLDVRIDRVIVK